MAKSVAARIFGDDYQARVFWIQACRLFDVRSKVVSVEMEALNIKSLDDVVVRYAGMFDGTVPIHADFYQVKFHVASDGAFTWQGMMDPSFINATSVSLLQRLHNAQLEHAPEGMGSRFHVYSPWAVHPDDPLAKLVSMTDGHVRWDVLSKGGSRSTMGKIREEWRKHLNMNCDEELRVALSPLRLQQGPTLEDLAKTLNDKLQIAGMKPVVEGTMSHPYDDLARKFIQKGRVTFTRQDIEGLCRQEGLWIGRPILERGVRRIGIRSFLRFAEYIEDETDEHLCLLRHFDGRRTKKADDWNSYVLPEVINFLQRSVKSGERCILIMPAHGGIAFLAGWCLDPKSGVDIALIQSGIRGQEVWKFGGLDCSREKYPPFEITSLPTKGDGHEVALAVSVTHDILSDVSLFVQRDLPRVSRIVQMKLPATGATSISDANHAQILSQQISIFLKNDRILEERGAILHLFFSAPNVFMFSLGRHGRSFGLCTLYEYGFDRSLPGDYWPSINVPLADRNF